MSAIETLKGFVNTWECDENDHLNVQFYFRFFEDAAGHFQRLAGVPARDRREPRARHVRYHAELRANAGVRVESFGASDRQAVHLLYETSDGRLSATCLESYDDPPAGLRNGLLRHGGVPPETAAPRSVAPGPDTAGAAEGTLVLAARMRAPHCRPDGSVFDSAIIGLNSDAAAQFWELIGIDRAFLEERNCGRVAVEMKLTRTGPLVLGDLVHVVSRPVAIARSTVTFENLFVRSETGEVAAIVRVTGLTMSFETRRAAQLPEDLRARAEALIASYG